LASDLTKAELQRLRRRDWPALREAWLPYVPSLPAPGIFTEQSSEELLDVQSFSPSLDGVSRSEQIEGVRSSVLSESMMLYQKAKHSWFAAKRLHEEGLETWSLFNKYHSAYLGAKGIMYLLGVTVPLLNSKRWIVDIFAAPDDDRSGKRIKPGSLTDFMAIPIPGLDQHQMWAWFQRVLASTTSMPWDAKLGRDIHLIQSSRDITRQRNGLLYKPTYWIANDLFAPLPSPLTLPEKYGLDVSSSEFLAALSDHVQSIFDALILDMAQVSLPIRRQMDSALVSPPN
jgi:hypothetical protein